MTNKPPEKRGPGRPPTGAVKMRKILIAMRAEDIATAQLLGHGNLSAGVREALQRQAVKSE